MRLLYVLPSLGARGGIDRSARRIIATMSRAGHDVSVIVPDFTLFPEDQKLDSSCLRFGALEPVQPETWVPSIRRAIDEFSPDLLVAYYGSSAGYAGIRAARERGLPGILCLRGNDVDRDREIPERARLVSWAIRNATAVTCVSREMIGKVSQWCDVTPEFVTNSVDPSEFFPEPEAGRAFRDALNLEPHRPTLGLFGVFKAKRGIERIASLEELTHWSVLLVGQVRPEVRTVIPPAWRRLPYLETITALRAAYAACDVVAQPSTMDGMPNVVLEAMACQRTVIASSVGGMPDVIRSGESGVLCPSGGGSRSAAEWEQQLRALRKNPRPDLAAAARRSVPSPEEEQAAFERVFSRALSSWHSS